MLLKKLSHFMHANQIVEQGKFFITDSRGESWVGELQLKMLRYMGPTLSVFFWRSYCISPK